MAPGKGKRAWGELGDVEVKDLADRKFSLFRSQPFHPSLGFSKKGVVSKKTPSRPCLRLRLPGEIHEVTAKYFIKAVQIDFNHNSKFLLTYILMNVPYNFGNGAAFEDVAANICVKHIAH